TTASVSGDTVTLVRSAASTAYSVTIPFEGQTRSKLDEEVRAGKGNVLANPMQPLEEQVAKGKGVVIWATPDGQQAQLGVAVLFADAAGANTAAKSAESGWESQKLPLTLGLGVLQLQMPKIAKLLTELTGSLKFKGDGPMARVSALVGRTTLAEAITE